MADNTMMTVRSDTNLFAAAAAILLVAIFCGPVHALRIPVAQVYSVEGKAEYQPNGEVRAVPLARGTILAANDKIRIDSGATVGLYYRREGRQILRAENRTLSGNVGAFAPEVEPYRGDAVVFGATRGERDRDTEPWQCMPGGTPVFEAMPIFTWVIAKHSPPLPLLRTTIRLFQGDSKLGSTSIDSPLPGQTLVFHPPDNLEGDMYRLQTILEPADTTQDSFIQIVEFYVATPMKPIYGTDRNDVSDARVYFEDFLTPAFQCRGFQQTGWKTGTQAFQLKQKLTHRAGATVFSTSVIPASTP